MKKAVTVYATVTIVNQYVIDGLNEDDIEMKAGKLANQQLDKTSEFKHLSLAGWQLTGAMDVEDVEVRDDLPTGI